MVTPMPSSVTSAPKRATSSTISKVRPVPVEAEPRPSRRYLMPDLEIVDARNDHDPDLPYRSYVAAVTVVRPPVVVGVMITAVVLGDGARRRGPGRAGGRGGGRRRAGGRGGRSGRARGCGGRSGRAGGRGSRSGLTSSWSRSDCRGWTTRGGWRVWGRGAAWLRDVGHDRVAAGADRPPGTPEAVDALPVRLSGAGVAGEGVQRPAIGTVGEIQLAIVGSDGAEERTVGVAGGGSVGHAVRQFGVGPGFGATARVGAGELAPGLGVEQVEGAARSIDQYRPEPTDVGGRDGEGRRRQL
jgi:hypothetical protein